MKTELNNKKIAFQGTRGAYSEMTLRRFFSEDVIPTGFDQSEEVCQAVLSGEAACGILPVENSIVGNVDINLDLLYRYNFFTIAEVYFQIKHNLLALPGVKLKEIKEVFSHPIALQQCYDFIKKNKLKAVPDYDTAGASKSLVERKLTHQATISSSLCAEYYNLEIIRSDIQKVSNNYTRFFIFVKEDAIPISLIQEKTSLAFITNHHPGSLLNCLKKFAEFNINLTKIESRPIPENPFDYIFFADIQGGLNQDNVKDCLMALKQDTKSIKILGSYPVSRF